MAVQQALQLASVAVAQKALSGPAHSCRDHVLLYHVGHTLEPRRKRLCFNDREMPLSRQSREVDLGDTSDLYVIERQTTLQVHGTALGIKIGPTKSHAAVSSLTPSSVPPFVAVNLMCTYPLSMLLLSI